ncbi:MAG: hypothetical protein ACRENE_24460 [Polyangiaceae bacterium]
MEAEHDSRVGQAEPLAGQVGLYETVARIVALAGAPERATRVAAMRARFEELTGAFSPDDGWFEERSRAFWCDAVTRGRAGREVEAALGPAERAWLDPLERAHRGLFRAEGSLLRDVWSGAELELTEVDDSSRAELDASTGQLVDGRVVGAFSARVVAFLPGAVFHPREASDAIESVLVAARAAALATADVLDALLRMERTLRSLARVKAAYAYRPEALSRGAPVVPVRRIAKGPI